MGNRGRGIQSVVPKSYRSRKGEKARKGIKGGGTKASEREVFAVGMYGWKGKVKRNFFLFHSQEAAPIGFF